MLADHHRKNFWAYCSLVLLGGWLIAAPLMFGFGDFAAAQPSGGREVWLGGVARATAIFWSDALSGFALLFFGFRSLRPNRPYSVWSCCFVGAWLTFAPIVFWAPSAAAYINDTLVGMLVIAFSVLIPGMPNMMTFMKEGPEVPPGWSYNPSSWPQRGILILLAFAGLLVSRYLAAFQLGYISRAWDPFFGPSTENVLNSNMSHMWPVSDAAFGAVAYTFEFLMGWMGGTDRWRTMPWMVTFFGILVIPLGLVHIFLVISQPVVVGAWCTLCLLAAAIMLPMIPLQADEVVAMGQFLFSARKRGESLWHAFWFGGTMPGGGKDERSPDLVTSTPRSLGSASVWGISLPWRLVFAAAIGVWLMFAPAVFSSSGTSANLDRVAGALVITFAVIAAGEVVRGARFVNVLLGLGLVVATWMVDGGSVTTRLNDTIAGGAVLALSLARGAVRERYGDWGQTYIA